MIKPLIFFLALILASCARNSPDPPKTGQFNFTLLYNGADTTYAANNDSVYSICLLPVINNLSPDTVTLVRSIYGRHDRAAGFNVYPKFGINVYQGGKKVEHSFTRICGNYGSLSPDAFVTVYPNRPFLPFHDSYLSHPNNDVMFAVKIHAKGAVEIEAYYNTADTTQQLYHPFSDNEMKMVLAIEDYNACRPLFTKLAHVNLKSNRVKVFLK